MATATLTSKGQLTLPKSVRDRMGLDSGDRVEFVEVTDGVFNIVATTRDIRELKGMIPKPEKSVSLEDMNRAIAQRGGRR
jgi:AbrB family looped-hinge helix DNA binding protein